MLAWLGGIGCTLHFPMHYGIQRGHKLQVFICAAGSLLTNSHERQLHDNNGGHLCEPSASGSCSSQSHPENHPKVPKRFGKSLKNIQKDRVHLNGRSAARVETPEASSSQRKPEQGQYPSGIHHTGICQTKTSFWKFGEQLGVTAFPAPHYGTFRRTKEEKSTLRLDVFASLFLWYMQMLKVSFKGNNLCAITNGKQGCSGLQTFVKLLPISFENKNIFWCGSWPE